MRAQFLVLSAFAGIAVLAGPAQAQGQRIAYLNSQRILAEAPGSQEVRTQIQQEMARFEAQVKVLSDSLDAMISDYQKKAVLLSPEEKQRQETAINTRRQQLSQRAQAIEAEAGQRQNELMAPIMNRIEEVIESIRQEGGYAIIFDAAQPGIVSADTTLDVTMSVIEKLKTAASSGPRAKHP